MLAPQRLLSVLAWTFASILTVSATAKAQFFKPDLTVTSLWSSPTTLVPGQRASIKALIKNIGKKSAPISYVGFYVDSRFVAYRGIPALSVNQSTSVTLSYVVPYNLRIGRILVQAHADYVNRITESNESNNRRAVTAIGAGGVDLYVRSLSLITGSAWGTGSQGKVTLTIANRGYYSASQSYVGFYLSTDSRYSTTDRYLGSYAVSPVLGGGSRTLSQLPLTLPGNLTPGRYYLLAVCDRTHRIREYNEGNNVRAISTMVYLTGRFSSYGTACKGSNGIPLQSAQSVLPARDPKIGSSVRYLLTKGPKSSVAIFMIGFSNGIWGPFRLPLDLKFMGSPGCSLLTGPMIQLTALTNGLGSASVPLALPRLNSLVGGSLYTQYVGWDGKANVLGLSFSNGVKTLIGSPH